MIELTGKQRKYLRGLAHALHSVVQVGQQGLTAAVVRQLDEALLQHELIKVRIETDKTDRGVLTERIVAATEAGLAGAIGHVIVLYRPHPDRRRRKVVLPK